MTTEMYGPIHVQTGTEVIPEPPLEGTYRGVVTVVERMIDAAGDTFASELELPNLQHQLPARIGC